MTTTSPWCLVLALLLVPAAACRATRPDVTAGGPGAAARAPDDPERHLDWTLGAWSGVRAGGDDDEAGPITMTVRPILAGAGQTYEIEVPHEAGVYRGFGVQVHDPAAGRWHRRYVNATRRTFSILEGEAGPGRATWRGADPARTRASRVLSERVGDDGWRRTMSISEDGGETWRVLWTDELRRTR